MAIRPIIAAPNPVLRKQARRIQAIDARIRAIARDMLDTLVHAEGVGLAAPQIGVSLRLCVLHVPEKEPFVLINPEIVKRIGEREVVEGCLSIPGYQGKIRRAIEVTAKGLDLNGKPVRFKARELLSQALEHEIDHLNGVLYIDYLESPDMLCKIELEKEAQSEMAAHVS
ncbi:MAG: peptide deformylase [Dehalococcoidia bacterium]|nr:peptide deformylase [Dehalococcoidia bacterium]